MILSDVRTLSDITLEGRLRILCDLAAHLLTRRQIPVGPRSTTSDLA